MFSIVDNLWLTTLNNVGSTTWFNPVFIRPEQVVRFLLCSCDGMNVAVFTHAALDVVSGLKYLHQNNIAHRDLKPSNILVSNRHYHHLSDQEKIKQIISIKPLVCKLADFGESRSTDIQTQNILKCGFYLIVWIEVETARSIRSQQKLCRTMCRTRIYEHALTYRAGDATGYLHERK